MPLTLNLLHEEQKQLQARQRDPLKLGILALVGVALLFMGYYGYRVLGASAQTNELHTRQAEWAKQQPLAAAAQTQEIELNGKLATAAAVSKRIEGRFYWAPLLDTLRRAVPPAIQVTNFSGSNDMAAEKVVIGVEGVGAGPEPRAAAEQFRIGLVDALGKKYQGVSASFRNLEESNAVVSLEGKTLPTVKFSIDVQMKKVSPAPEAAAAHPRAK